MYETSLIRIDWTYAMLICMEGFQKRGRPVYRLRVGDEREPVLMPINGRRMRACSAWRLY